MENIESYSYDIIVKYYKKISEYGLFNYEKSMISSYFHKPSKVLDVGCGTGRTTIALNRMGYDVIGIDYSAKMIEVAKKIAPNILYEIQDARSLTFDSETFDYVLFSFNGLMLLETYTDRKKVVLEIARVLKKGGLFFFTTPFLDNKIDKKYWQEKIKSFNKNIEDFTTAELLKLGDDIINEDGVEFQLHIPFIKEIYKLMDECCFEVLSSERRLDSFTEDPHETELDDNYLWIVKKHVLV